MATLAWVKNPQLVSNWTRHRLIADSYAALRPSAELWKKYADEIAKLQERKAISEEEYNLLRFSMVARNALMQSTLGSPDAFTEGTVQQILEVAKTNLRKDTLDALASEQRRRSEAETAVINGERSFQEYVRRQRDHIKSIASFAGRLARRFMYVACGALALVGFWATLPSPFTLSIPPRSWVLPVVLLAFSGFAVWSLIEGGTVRQLARKVEIRAATFVERHLSAYFNLPESE